MAAQQADHPLLPPTASLAVNHPSIHPSITSVYLGSSCLLSIQHQLRVECVCPSTSAFSKKKKPSAQVAFSDLLLHTASPWLKSRPVSTHNPCRYRRLSTGLQQATTPIPCVTYPRMSGCRRVRGLSLGIATATKPRPLVVAAPALGDPRFP